MVGIVFKQSLVCWVKMSILFLNVCIWIDQIDGDAKVMLCEQIILVVFLKRSGIVLNEPKQTVFNKR